MYVQVLPSTLEEGNVATPEDFKLLCEKVADSRNFMFCPRIQLKEYEQYKEVIRYDPKRVKIVDVPVKRITSAKCECWFPLARSGITKEKQLASEVLCRECLQLRRYLQSSVR